MYRRYIKQFNAELTKALLRHAMGRYPLVDVYELLPVVSRLRPEDAKNGSLADCKLLFYYGEEDANRYGLEVKVYRDRPEYLGIPFERMLLDVGVEYQDDDTIQDVINDLETALRADPNDEVKFCSSPWVEDCCERHRTVADLKKADQWKDLYIAIKPRKLAFGTGHVERTPLADSNPQADRLQDFPVEVTHISYDTLLIEVGKDSEERFPETLDLMFLLRS
jgi:hypothetical protein